MREQTIKIGDMVQYVLNPSFYGIIVDNYYDGNMTLHPDYFGVVWLNGMDQSVKVTSVSNLVKVSHEENYGTK
jgi:hypothetical protein